MKKPNFKLIPVKELAVKSESPRARKVRLGKDNVRHYTIGQIFRLGLLKTFDGQPYKDKATVGRIVSRLPHRVINTAWGKAKVVDERVIARFNASRASQAK